MTPENKLVVFKGKDIRRVLHNDEWFFSVIDIVGALTDSGNARRYWSDLKRKLAEEGGFSELYEKIVQLKMEAPDGKGRRQQPRSPGIGTPEVLTRIGRPLNQAARLPVMPARSWNKKAAGRWFQGRIIYQEAA